MKKATTLLIALFLTVGSIRALPTQAKKISAMIESTSIVSQNDDSCCGMNVIQSIYRHDKAIQDSYDGDGIYVYIYHCLDGQGLSHNELEINTNRDQFRYDI